MRNYRAMHPPKLARCIEELEAQSGVALTSGGAATLGRPSSCEGNRVGEAHD